MCGGGSLGMMIFGALLGLSSLSAKSIEQHCSGFQLNDHCNATGPGNSTISSGMLLVQLAQY